MTKIESQTPKKLIIFDWDGTLVDSVADISNSLCVAANKFGIALSPHEAKQVIGLALPEAMQVLFPNHAPLHQELLAAYSEHYLKYSQTLVFEGIKAFLEGLRQQGILLAVATGKSRAGLDRVIGPSQLASYFIKTKTASETLSKPDPKMLNEILSELNLTAKDSLMVGDSTYDLEMANRAGMQAIGVSYGVHTYEQLNKYHPVAIASNLDELKTLIQNAIDGNLSI